MLDEGFENWWISSLVNNEINELEKILADTRKVAYMDVFGSFDVSDIDIMDERWEQVKKYIDQAKAKYFEGEYSSHIGAV